MQTRKTAVGRLPPGRKILPASFRRLPVPPREWIIGNHSVAEIAVPGGSVLPVEVLQPVQDEH